MRYSLSAQAQESDLLRGILPAVRSGGQGLGLGVSVWEQGTGFSESEDTVIAGTRQTAATWQTLTRKGNCPSIVRVRSVVPQLVRDSRLLYLCLHPRNQLTRPHSERNRPERHSRYSRCPSPTSLKFSPCPQQASLTRIWGVPRHSNHTKTIAQKAYHCVRTGTDTKSWKK